MCKITRMVLSESQLSSIQSAISNRTSHTSHHKFTHSHLSDLLLFGVCWQLSFDVL